VDELIPKEDLGIISMLYNKEGILTIPKLFTRDIFLYYTHIAGTSHTDGIAGIEPLLNEGDRLEFFREPDNPHDGRAIVIRTLNGVKIGYIPRADNIILSRLMDAGKLLFGTIKSKEWQNKWLRINIKIYMGD